MEATQLGIYCGNNYEAEEVSLLRGGPFLFLFQRRLTENCMKPM